MSRPQLHTKPHMAPVNFFICGRGRTAATSGCQRTWIDGRSQGGRCGQFFASTSYVGSCGCGHHLLDNDECAGVWIALNDSTPADNPNLFGIDAIAINPNDASKLYMVRRLGPRAEQESAVSNLVESPGL